MQMFLIHPKYEYANNHKYGSVKHLSLYMKKCQAVVPPRSITSIGVFKYSCLIGEKKEYSQGSFKRVLKWRIKLLNFKEVKFLCPRECK